MAASDGREEWEKILRAGKQEGRVVLYTFPGQELVFQEFQKNFPVIKVVEVSVRGSERVKRIVSERRAGRFLADILIGGVGSAQSGLLKTGLLDPIKPGLILPKFWTSRNGGRESTSTETMRTNISSLSAARRFIIFTITPRC